MTPRYPVDQLHRNLNRLLDGFVNRGAEVSWPFAGHGPAANVWETADAVRVELELPGLKSDQIDLSVVGDELSIKIERPDVDEQGATYFRRERGLGSSARVLQLPVEVNADRVEAELSHGVLSVTLPKAESVRPRKVRVTSAG